MPPDQSGASMFVPMILIFLIFYFLVFRPQKKEQKEKQQLRERLKKNDEVITVGGIHGTVVLTKDKTVVLRVDDNTKIEFDRESIVTLVKSKSES
jgi:preprotein translocase subunit YajC